MRDILTELETSGGLSDPNPVRRAQSSMRKQLPKRFYETVSVAAVDEGHAVQLDGKAVRTPGRAVLAVPTAAAAQLVADEFAAQIDIIDPFTMPVLRLVNTAIDDVATNPQGVLEDILRFSSSDLLCYRADQPERLFKRQAEAWDPVIDWARASLDACFVVTEGVIHVDQPRAAIAALGVHLSQRAEPMRLAALHLVTTLTGSAILALAVETGELSVEAAWATAHVDEDWQSEHWGQDSEAMARRANHMRDMLSAVALLNALKAC